MYAVDTIKNLPEVLQPEHIANNTNGEITMFWSKDSFLFNFNPSKFEKDGVTYCCNEQYLISQKALLFKDPDIHKKIMESKNPAEMKHICVQNYDHDICKRERLRIMKEGYFINFAKMQCTKKNLSKPRHRSCVKQAHMTHTGAVG